MGFSNGLWYNSRMNFDALLAENTTLKQQLSERDEKIAYLMEQLNLSKQKQFGRSSEKLDSPQLELLDEAEVFSDDTQEEPVLESEETVEVPAHKRKKKRVSLPDTLPRVDVIHDLPDAEKVCPHDGSILKQIGEDISEQLNYIPAKLEVIRHRCLKYACPCCDQHIASAKKPKQPIPKSFASAALLAQIATFKYVDGQPLYRQVQAFKRLGIELDTTTLANWMIRCGELIQPLINLLLEKALEHDLLHMDETIVQVLREVGRRPEQESRMWVMATPTVSAQAVVLYRYEETRSASVISDWLETSKVALMTDGYVGYDAEAKVSSRILLGCWAHARRYFIDAQKVQPKGKTGKADQALALIRKLYLIEKKAKDLSIEARYTQRQEHSQPILEQLRQWLDKSLQNPIKKSQLAKALTYLHNQWPKLIRYTENGAWPIDNNRAENAIRPFVIGRKNWLFSTSPKGATASANLYSLMETAKANGLEPSAYLKEVFTKLPLAESVEDIEALLPWAIKAKQEK